MADVVPDLVAGYGTLFTFPAGGSTIQYQVGGVDIEAFYSATHSSGFPPPSGPVPADIVGVTNMGGTVAFGAGSIQLEIGGLVMGTVPTPSLNSATT